MKNQISTGGIKNRLLNFILKPSKGKFKRFKESNLLRRDKRFGKILFPTIM